VILGNLVEIFTNFDRGFFYTAKELLRQPGRVITDYIGGATVRYINPFRFLLLAVGISTLVNLSLGIYDLQAAEVNDDLNAMMGMEGNEELIERQQRLQREMRKYVNLVPLIIVPFISMMSVIFFKRRQYNYAEQLVVNAFFFGELSLIGIPLLLLFALFPNLIAYAMPIGILLGIVYYTYAMQRLFDFSVLSTFFRAVGVYLGGFVVTLIFFALVGLITGIVMAFFM